MTFVETLTEKAFQIAVQIGIDPYPARLLAERLGREVCQEYRGERVYIPSGSDRQLIADRDAGIVRDRIRGMSWRRIARKWLVSPTQARRICASVPQIALRAAQQSG